MVVGKRNPTDTNNTWALGESIVMIRFRCKDIDLKDCEFQVQGAVKEEILEIALTHLEKHHRIVNITAETRERIQRAVKG